MSSGRKTRSTPRQRLYRLHTWVGFHLVLFTALVTGTGTLAVVSDEIDWLFQPELRAGPRGDAPVSWGELERAIRQDRPDDTLVVLSAGEGAYLAHRALMTTPSGDSYYLYIDPWSGQVTGTTSTLTVQRFLRDLHRYLFMSSIAGLPLVTVVACVLAVSLYTGLRTVRKWRKAAVLLRFNKGARVAIGDLHRAAGLWIALFIALIVVTSFWYFAELAFAVGGTRFEPVRPGVDDQRLSAYGSVADVADADTLVTAATQAFPGLRPAEIQFATQPNLAVTVLGYHRDPVARKRANRVFLDPVSAEVIKVQRSTEINWVAYLNELADPLHFGSFGKLYTKLLWFVFGLMLFGMSLTGVWLTWRRAKSRAPSHYQIATIPLIALVVVSGHSYVKGYLVRAEELPAFSLPAKAQDTIQVQPHLGRGTAGDFDGKLALQLTSPNGRINLLSASVSTSGNNGNTVVLTPDILGHRINLSGQLPTSSFQGAQSLEVQLSYPGGATHRHTWQLQSEAYSSDTRNSVRE